MGLQQLTVKIAAAISLALFLSIAFQVISAIQSLSITENDSKGRLLCGLPREIIFNYFLISHTYKNDYGELGGQHVANFWLSHQGVGRPPQLYLSEANDDPKKTNFTKSTYTRIISENFRLNEPLSEDEYNYFKKQMSSVIENCPNSVRRSEASERFNDFLKHIGLATILGLILAMTNRILKQN